MNDEVGELHHDFLFTVSGKEGIPNEQQVNYNQEAAFNFVVPCSLFNIHYSPGYIRT